MGKFINKNNFFSNKDACKKPYLILEAGINHEGSFLKAQKLIDHAKTTGADAVKFQYFELDDFYLPDSIGYKNLKKMYLSKEKIYNLKKYANKKKIIFLCTAYVKKSFDFLNQNVGVKIHKISSMDNNNFDLIEHVAKFKKPMIISTGMSSVDNLLSVKKIINKYKNNKLAFLHCISNYPTSPSELNLININYLKTMLNSPIGLSDHTENIFGMIASLNFKPQIIEKHFTFDKKRKGFDHNISANKNDILFFYKYLDFYNKSHGKNFNRVNIRPDYKNQKFFRKGIFYKKSYKEGQEISFKDLLIARPGKNYNMLSLLSKKKKIKLKRNVKKFSPINNKRDIK